MAEDPNSPQGIGTFTGCFARLFWMAAGNVALFMLLILIARNKALSLSVCDLGLWGLAAAMAAVRYLDITRLGGQTTEGEPATLAHWRRYTLGLAAVTGFLWITGHLLALTEFMR